MNGTVAELPIASPSTGAPHPKAATGTAAALGLVGWSVTFIGSWVPSFWGDEAASIMSAERPLDTIWRELGRVDAVHGTYYLFLHFWIEAFGASELSVRLPSTIAVGVAVSGTVVLGGLLFRGTPSIAVIAGLVMILLPRVDYMAAEGRSYALGTAAATWLTVFFVTLVRRRVTCALAWFGFAVAFAAAIFLFLYLALLAAVYGSALLTRPAGRAVVSRWLAATALGVVLASPVIGYALSQHGQIASPAHRGYVTFARLFVIQRFGNPPLAVLCWALIGVAIFSLARTRSRSLALVAGWLLLPMVILLVGNTVLAPMYTIRYLSFSAPAAALLVAVGVVALTERVRSAPGIRVAAVLVLVALALSTDVQQRSAYAKDGGSDWRAVAQVIGANAHRGDAMVFDQPTSPSRRPRLALRLYPQYFAGLSDVTLRTPYYDRAGIWDYPIASIAPSLAAAGTVWNLELAGAPTTPTTAAPANIVALERIEYAISGRIPLHRTVLYELTRETP